jgi:hypothetical protein
MVRRPKNKSPLAKSISPTPTVFHRAPEALKREISTDFQRNYSDDTLFYGEDDALPLRIAKAIDESPAASACIDTIAQFIKGGGFSNPELAKMKIDKNGTTLWDFHCALAETIALYNGFSVNFKFNDSARITNTYILSFESVRFKKPPEGDPYIHHIAFNPYFGTDLYNKDYTQVYPVYDLVEAKKQLAELGTQFPGQVYYWGKTSPLYRFYPVPKYWTGKKWIYIDGRIQEAHAENLDNGWFQSVLMNVIGDPNQPSQNPKYIDTYTDPADGVIKQRSTKTVGEEFSDQMAATFSGSKKMGTVQVMWSLNSDTAAKIQEFPTNANADLFIALQDLTTKNITIATRVPSILANISEGVSLGSAGSEIQKAIELMQSRTAEFRMTLENFYNDILLPNLAKPISEKITIVNFNPITQPVEIDDKVWEFLNEQEKAEWIKKNFPGVTLFRTAAPAAATDPETGEPLPPPVTGNDALKNINLQQLGRIQAIVRKFNIGQVDPGNKNALTFDQAKQFLLGFGLTEQDINAWLITNEEA